MFMNKLSRLKKKLEKSADPLQQKKQVIKPRIQFSFSIVNLQHISADSYIHTERKR